MSIGRICQRDVDIVGPDDSVLAAAERMRQRTVGCLVVVEKGQCPSALLPTATWSCGSLPKTATPGTTTVGEVMTKFPDLAQEDMPIETALGLMRRRGPSAVCRLLIRREDWRDS